MRQLSPGRTALLITAFLIPWVSSALAVGNDHPKDKIIQQHPDWPKRLLDLVNSDQRIHGQWVNQNDFFCYKGNAAAFNKFLASYAKLPDTPLAVVIHAGVVPLTQPFDQTPPARFDWQLESVRRGWGAPVDPRRTNKDPGYVVTVHLWLSDTMTLAQIQIPKHVDVRSAGDVEHFVERHHE